MHSLATLALASLSLGVASTQAFHIPPMDSDHLQDRQVLDELQQGIRRRDIITPQQLNQSYGMSLAALSPPVLRNRGNWS